MSALWHVVAPHRALISALWSVWRRGAGPVPREPRRMGRQVADIMMRVALVAALLRSAIAILHGHAAICSSGLQQRQLRGSVWQLGVPPTAPASACDLRSLSPRSASAAPCPPRSSPMGRPCGSRILPRTAQKALSRRVSPSSPRGAGTRSPCLTARRRRCVPVDCAQANPDGMSAPDNCYLIHISESTILANMKAALCKQAHLHVHVQHPDRASTRSSS